ncbi:acyl-CoA dehydrogenase [Pseudotabrizicola sp. L79]|uniref:acyl-CoA dehydrogenase n=1 Tax=Pseudotabrizicola sp. L79 TaxID=3118402 RepID=UPI002F946625
MPYRAPVSDFRFLLDHVVGFDQVAKTDRFAEATPETVEAVLTEAGKLSETVLAGLNRAGDKTPARLENGVVRTPPGFADGYKAIAEGGWVAIAAGQDHGGMGLPLTVASAVTDMFSSACLSLQLCPLLTQGQIEALEHHASDALKATYLPKLIAGEWNGTMNLTEPQAGSDVGALRSKAEPNGDGSYAISGQKIYITWGDTDFLPNTVHLVLARLPDGGPGTKGISLFLVPKFIPDADGNPGKRNSLQVVSLEHKLGIHGSPTCVMQFDGATGWLVAPPHGGMAAMFTMMNNARLGVGLQGVGIAEAAYQQALDYANGRVQGKTPEAGQKSIIGHADVRRMLASMKAEVFSARAIGLACAVAIDMGHATGSAEWKARAALLTPIAKAYGTDVGVAVASEGVQIHGGMGFIEETGAAQFLRDVRITPIYEGTNGIQAMDLVARKMMDGGDAAFRLIGEIEANAKAARDALPDLAEDVWGAAETLREATEAMIARDLNDRFAGAVPYLRAFALILGAHYHLTAAMAEAEPGARRKLARIAIKRLLPDHAALLIQAAEGADDLYALSPEDLAA